MRVLIFHGYLLGGTGSNVYNARLAEALVHAGHEVHLLCQDRHPRELDFVEAVGDWDGGELRLEPVRTVAGSGREDDRAARCTVYRPNIGGLLPVYVADRYEGIEARTFARCSDGEIAHYIEANVTAVAEVERLARPDVALANHLVVGPAVLARALREAPYAAKIHGSALEYTVKPEPQRFLGLAREGLAGAQGVLVGSRHTAESLWEAIGDPELPARTRLGPPGVDVERFAPRGEREAAEGLRRLAHRLSEARPAGGPRAGASAFARDQAEAGVALSRLAGSGGPLVGFVGKLIVSKGVDLLVAAWPLVLERRPDARLVLVGFGAYRDGLERLVAALRGGETGAAKAIARAGRELEGDSPPARPLRHLLAFFESLAGSALERYEAAAARLESSLVFTGRLEHDELAELLPACDAVVVPSTFPEAFGMVAAEAAACGAFPISAAHSGLAEVSEVLAAAVPPEARQWLSFPVDDGAVRALAERLLAWLCAGEETRRRARAGIVASVREQWSWQHVGEGVIAAARGRLDELEEP